MKCYMFEVEVAEQYGVDAAVMLYHLQHWIFVNRANGKNFHEGRTWTYNSVRALAEIWPFWSTDHISRKLNKLAEDGVLVKGNYNKAGSDRTTWYAFAEEEAWFKSREAILQKRKMHVAQKQNVFRRNATPLPNPNTNISPDKNQLVFPPEKSDLDLVVGRDRAIVEGRDRLKAQIDRLLRPAGQREAATFARILNHLVHLCVTQQREPDVFDDAIGWVTEAKTDGKRPKAMFVAMVKEKTGFKKQKNYSKE